MSFWDNIRIALHALWGNRLRSFLALLGIVIGVFAVTALISLGQMASAGISSQLESMASRTIVIEPNFNLGFDVTRLTDADAQVLARLPVTVIPEVMNNAEYEKKPGDRRPVTLCGTPGDMPLVDASTRMARGRYFSPVEAQGGAGVAVLNERAAKDIFGEANPLGRPVKLLYPGGGRTEVMVVGVTEPFPLAFGSDPAQVFVPTALLWRTHPNVRRGQYEFLLLRVRGEVDIVAVEKQARALLAGRHSKDSLRTFTAESFKTTLGVITVILQSLLGAIGGLSLLVGGIGIMNIMLVSVTERTREIGLRKALGATSQQIRRQFLIEAVVLTLLGGLLGVLLAAGMLLLVSMTVPFFKVFIFSPATVALALGVSVLVGLFFGVWPAARAAALDPIEALRYE